MDAAEAKRGTAGAAKELVLTRTFDAPRGLVFKAWTDREHLARWWGPRGFTNPVCEATSFVGVQPAAAVETAGARNELVVVVEVPCAPTSSVMFTVLTALLKNAYVTPPRYTPGANPAAFVDMTDWPGADADATPVAGLTDNHVPPSAVAAEA